jgi:hypothetical protein
MGPFGGALLELVFHKSKNRRYLCPMSQSNWEKGGFLTKTAEQHFEAAFKSH